MILAFPMLDPLPKDVMSARQPLPAPRLGVNLLPNGKILSGDSEVIFFTKTEEGRVDEEKIRRLVPDFAARDIYVCGPPPMMNGIVALLKTMSVSGEQIHYEKFAF